MIVVRVLAFAAGLVVVLATLRAAILTVVVPRAERVVLSRAVFAGSRFAFEAIAGRTRSAARAEAARARFAPMTLMMLPATWVAGVMLGFVPMFWAVGVRPWGETFVLSGSSLTTLGFSRPNEGPAVALAVCEAVLGLGLVALLISFLPTIYGYFSRREMRVALMASRAGTPPTPAEWIIRSQMIGGLEVLDEAWPEWEQWFIELEESHTSHFALTFFRSPHLDRSWLVTAGTVLDTAAVRASTLDLPRNPEAELCIRAGYLALRSIADYFDIDYERHPRPDDRISVHRAEFDELYEQLRAAGVPLEPDRDQAWRDWAGWRVNYDAALIELCRLVKPSTAPWSSDRVPVNDEPRRRGRGVNRG